MKPVSIILTNRLMKFSGMVVICSEKHTGRQCTETTKMLASFVLSVLINIIYTPSNTAFINNKFLLNHQLLNYLKQHVSLFHRAF